MKFLKGERNDFNESFNRLWRRDFSGNTGQAIKNSTWQLATLGITKIGSLIFTWFILMKMLSPELFGLYSLALATILIFAGFSDMGIGNTLIRYVAKKKYRSRGYILYLLKIKLILLFIVALILMISARFISNYYNKPIYLALLLGGIYIFCVHMASFIEMIFKAHEDFRHPFFKELIFQLFKFTLIPIALLFFASSSDHIIITSVIISISLSYFLAMIFLIFKMKNYSGKPLSKKEKHELNSFMIPLSATALSGVFFGYIDTVMLGRFVALEFIAYYQAAFSLIVSVMVIISFSGVLLPMFSRMKRGQLERGFKKSTSITMLLSILLIIGTIIIAPYLISLIKIITSYDYTPSINLLRILSIILFTDPLIGIYTSYYTSIGKTGKVAISVIISTIVNIILNLFLIWKLLPLGMGAAVIGVSIATVISRLVYLGILWTWKEKK